MKKNSYLYETFDDTLKTQTRKWSAVVGNSFPVSSTSSSSWSTLASLEPEVSEVESVVFPFPVVVLLVLFRSERKEKDEFWQVFMNFDKFYWFFMSNIKFC